jgi:putative DNA primase/helicase
VIDTLHRFLRGDENSAQDAKGMLDACAALQLEFGCTVILVHHTGVSDEAQHRARGSSAWKGALDIEISIVPSKNYGPIGIVQRKSKDAEEAENMYVDLQSVPIEGWMDEDGEQVTSAVLEAGVEPVKAKSDGALEKAKKLLERAWWASGTEDRNGAPYVSRTALKSFLLKDGYKPRTIENMMNVTYDGKMIGRLTASEIIITSANGWSVNETAFATTLMLMRSK